MGRVGGDIYTHRVLILRFLAVLEGHTGLVPRPGPIHGMSRAIYAQVHSLAASHTCEATGTVEDDHNPITFACFLNNRHIHASAVHSACDEHHEHMQTVHWRAQIEERAHLLSVAYRRLNVSLVGLAQHPD